jgi:hypothetical protein
MSFQINDKEGKAIPISELDKEAALSWGKEVESRSYADPTPLFTNDENLQGEELRKAMWDYEMRRTGNWFDVIGHSIHDQGNAMGGWANVVHTMMSANYPSAFIDTSAGYKDRPVKLKMSFTQEGKECTLHLDRDLEMSLIGSLMYYTPYIDLINHWHSKGYKPIKVKD